MSISAIHVLPLFGWLETWMSCFHIHNSTQANCISIARLKSSPTWDWLKIELFFVSSLGHSGTWLRMHAWTRVILAGGNQLLSLSPWTKGTAYVPHQTNCSMPWIVSYKFIGRCSPPRCRKVFPYLSSIWIAFPASCCWTWDLSLLKMEKKNHGLYFYF